MKGQAPPAPSTRAKYGITLTFWRYLFKQTRGCCPVCGRDVVLVIDHEHVPRWKTMEPEVRATYVRGLLCHMCNHFILTRYATPERLRQAANYLERYEERRARGR